MLQIDVEQFQELRTQSHDSDLRIVIRSVNGILSSNAFAALRIKCRPMQHADNIAKSRIDERLKQIGMSTRQASIKAGMNPDTLGKFFAGKTRSLKADNLSSLAKVLDVSESWLMGTINDKNEYDERPFGVRFGGVVEAGAFRPQNDHSQDDEYRTIALPHDMRFPLSAQYAFSVTGDSMTLEKIFEGMYVLAVDVMTWERLMGQPRDGNLVVVARTRNGHPERELTVKKLRLYTDRMELQPCSDNPAYEPLVFPLPLHELDQTEATIIAVVLSATWIYG
jgi:SOS-response transcriptional repressor LexA